MLWAEIVDEARNICRKDVFLTDVMNHSIIDHANYSSAITALLAFHFDANITADRWRDLFASVVNGSTLYNDNMGTVESMGILDLQAIKERDPACDGLVEPFLYNKGFKALQAHRIAHILWRNGRKDVARAIQSRCSELYGLDIHPGATIDSGLMLDHGTGIVIGETARIGRNCSFLHGVTLGSTGKETGDRHPKIGNDVLIGCNASLLGNITIGDSCKIGSGSIVLRSFPSNVTAVGNPAKVVGTSLCAKAAASMDVALHNVVTKQGVAYDLGWNMEYADGI